MLATVLSAFFGILGANLGGIMDEAFSLFSERLPRDPRPAARDRVISGLVPEARGLRTIAIVLAITSWAGSARVLRAQTMSIRSRDYVSAARVAGERPWRVIAVERSCRTCSRCSRPSSCSPVIAAILGEAGLSFLGLGASNSSTLGTMLFYAQTGSPSRRAPGGGSCRRGCSSPLLGMGLSLVNFSIDEVINPRLANVRAQRRRETSRASCGTD